MQTQLKPKGPLWIFSVLRDISILLPLSEEQIYSQYFIILVQTFFGFVCLFLKRSLGQRIHSRFHSRFRLE